MEEGKQSLPNEISAVLIRWYETHRRELPWRETTDPYRIWISEIILQQTRVAQGLEYYLHFVERFPDVRSLAGAHEDEVMKLWQGLGYYRRARNLHAAAREVSGKYAGLFPADYASVRALKYCSRDLLVCIRSASCDGGRECLPRTGTLIRA